MKNKRYLLIIIACFPCLFGPLHAAPPKTVSKVDIERYMGRWYEISAFPAYFERGCRCTFADYQLKNNKVHVTNRCVRKGKNGFTQANGIAWPVPDSQFSKLKVQFFWPFTGDYWILYLSSNYHDVIVGTPNRKYLWILSRAPHMSQIRYEQLLKIANSKGFDTSKLVKAQQTCQSYPKPIEK